MEIITISKGAGTIVLSYLIGAIPFCYIIGKLVSGKKLTEIGDKNPGGWNLAFNVSRIWGILGMIFDVAKGFLPYFLTYRFAEKGFISFLGTTNNSLIAMLAGVAAVAGHNYSPYIKFKGGKGIATWMGFLLAAHPFTIPCVAVGMVLGLFVAKNMIWAVTISIIFSSTFLWIYRGSIIYLIMMLLLIAVMIPKQINYSKKMSTNFKFRKEATVKDLFTPKIR